jgi:uncharacterized protein DUF1980
LISVDSNRFLRALVLGVWTAVFAWLWIDNAATIYVGPRTAWVVPLGTVALGFCTAVVFFGALSGRGSAARPSLRELAGYAILLAPVVAILVVDSPQLGANAANNKADVKLSVDELPANDGGVLDLVAVAAATEDPEIAKALGVNEGKRPTAFPGIVTRVNGPMLEVTRFKIYCCAADAVPYTAHVQDANGEASDLEINDWVYVRGTVQTGAGGELVVTGDRIEPVAAPLDPYL